MRTTIRIRLRDWLLAVLALIGFLLICFAASATRRTSHAVAPQDFGTPNPSAKQAPAQADDLPGKAPKPFHLSIPNWIVADLVWLIAAILFGLLIWAIVKLGPLLSDVRWRRKRKRQSEDQDEATQEYDQVTQDRLTRAFNDALAGVDVGDANRAIVACWIRLEQIAEEVGFARQAWETSSELVTRWLGGWSLPTDALTRLAELYREARYSGHAMSREQIELARSTLTEMRRAFQLVPTMDSPSQPVDDDD